MTTTWTVVGKGGHRAGQIVEMADTKAIDEGNLSAEDIFESNQATVSSKIKSMLADLIKGMSQAELVPIMFDTATFALSQIASESEAKVTEVKTITDDQRKIISIDGLVVPIENNFSDINYAIQTIEDNIAVLKKYKTQSLEKLQRFLATCGIDEVGVAPIVSPSTPKRSWASTIGATVSPLVTEKMDTRSYDTPNKTIRLNTTISSIDIPLAESAGECRELTLTYFKPRDITVVKIKDTMFTVGPGVFVGRTKDSSRNEYAKRCLNKPCKYTACKFYHDPSVTRVHDASSPHRVFVLSYVTQMLDMIKNDDDIKNISAVRDHNFVRDLVQLAGTILFRASQIKHRYLQYNL